MVQLSKAFVATSTRRQAVEAPPVFARRRNWAGLFPEPAYWDVANVITESMLDRVERLLTGPDREVESGMKELLTVLWKVKSTSSTEVWQTVMTQCLSHPVRRLIHEDPFADRCFRKPRGYAGDAVLIDYLYTRSYKSAERREVTPLGRSIFEFTRDIPAGHAVRQRRDMMALIIDQVCSVKPTPHILSVACGHLREASLSEAVTSHSIERFLALDQDEQSLATVEQESAGFGITAVHNSVKALFRGPVSEEKFDLIYSTGLYDYLDDRLATKLTSRMFDMLNPGGRVVVANFVPDLLCSAYMDAMLDWKLIYRDVDQVRGLASAIAPSEIASTKVYVEKNGNIAFLDLLKH